MPDGKLEWAQSHAQVPIAERISDELVRIYYATRDTLGRSNISFIEVDSNNPSIVIYKHMEPILQLGKLGTFDESGVMPTSVITMGNQKYLYYIGWSLKKTVPYQNAIGLAISSDGGKSFRKYAEGPIIGINNIDPYFTGTLNVLNDGNIIRGYYLSCVGWEIHDGKPEPLYVLKYAESEDGINWVRSGKIIVDFKDENEGGLVSASVIKDSNKYKMWFARRNRSDYRFNILNSYRIAYAESFDGVNWIRKDEESGISVSKDGWDSEMVAYPNVMNINGMLTMFYNGNGFGKTGFGYSIYR